LPFNAAKPVGDRLSQFLSETRHCLIDLNQSPVTGTQLAVLLLLWLIPCGLYGSTQASWKAVWCKAQLKFTDAFCVAMFGVKMAHDIDSSGYVTTGTIGNGTCCNDFNETTL